MTSVAACVAFWVAMSSYAAFLDASENAAKRHQGIGRLHRNVPASLDSNLDHGDRIVTKLTSEIGVERTAELLQSLAKKANGSQPSGEHGVVDLDSDDDDAEVAKVPYGFWKRFCEDDLNLLYTARKRKQFSRALQFVATRQYGGCQTRQASRGMRKGSSYRNSAGSQNSTKAVGLGFALLQYFVDVVQNLSCRADSLMLLTKARELRRELLYDESGRWEASSLPKLIGNAGAKWFQRWRRKYGIAKKVTGMKLKVSWRKIKKRVQVLLSNEFKIREWWRMCFPDKPMRWLSLDQKPSWWNNAGLTGTWAKKGGSQPSVTENFAHTRTRYSILTAVPHGWDMRDHVCPTAENVPLIAMLFKGKPNGKIIKKLKRNPLLKPWVKMQVQEEGSYRSVDMVEALDWMLPVARSLDESIIVLLDWFSGHLTDEVREVIERKGHVLLHHGGGTTPFTQINDTHLHSLLSRLLIQLENMIAVERRKRRLAMGIKKTPSAKREDIVELVQAAWVGIDHKGLAEKGYKQTGPTLPMTGPVKPEEVYKDLLKVIEAIDPTSTPTEVSLTKIREDSINFVRQGAENQWWTKWEDYHLLIEGHDSEDEPAAEGLEAFGAEPHDDAEKDEDSEEDDEEGAAADGGADDGSKPSPDSDDGVSDDERTTVKLLLKIRTMMRMMVMVVVGLKAFRRCLLLKQHCLVPKFLVARSLVPKC